jgi:hypothetical protein
MTTTTTAPGAQATTPRPGPLRRYRPAILVGAALVLAVVFAILGNRPTHPGVADPQNPNPEGAQALARVLDREGVDVQVVRGAAAMDNARVDRDTTVVVTSTENLGSSTVRRLTDHLGAARLVLVEPRYGIARLFGEQDSTPILDRTRSTGDCADSRFEDLRIDVDAATSYPDAPTSCFPATGGHLLVQPRPNLTLLGSTDLISNEQVTRADNAAVALRLLGQSDRLVWYVPDPGDLAAGDGVTLGSLLPDWLRPGLVLATVALLAVLWWRGRRLGRLAVEPLPVAISAIESTRSRARLYRKVNDRSYAAHALRAAARRRLAERLSLPRGAADDVAGLVRDLAPYTRLEHARLLALLSHDAAPPADDRDLILLANDLADLMREVHDS